MDPETWTKICQLFDELVELPEAERLAVLDDACGPEHADVRVEVERMLAADRTRADLDEPISRIPKLEEASDEGPRPGTNVGGFELVEVIAEGGMATVFRAEQREPARSVALKLHRGNLFSVAGLRRFRYEGEVLASMRHPGIAQLYEAGTHWRQVGGVWAQQPYVAIELVDDARDIVTYARTRALTIPERLELFEQVCEAVSYAHRNGVLHRDLKPGNILVDGTGRARVIDFGIASPTDASEITERLTLEGQTVGTLATMCPEQLEGGSGRVDVRCDVYSLGAVLFELLEDAPARDLSGLSLAGAVTTVREEAIRAPQSSPRELRWILQRALEHEASRRYDSVEQLAEDLRRYRSHEPLRAGPPSRTYALRKFVRRHLGVLVASLLILGALGFGYARAEHLREVAEDAEKVARLESSRVMAVHDLLLGMVLNAGGPEATVSELLDSGRARLDSALIEDPRVRANAQATLGKAYLGIDLVEAGEELLKEALAYELEFGEPGSETWIQVQRDWMALLLRKRRFAEALELCDQLLAWNEKSANPDRATRANLLARRGAMQEGLGRLSEARESFGVALEFFRSNGMTQNADYWSTWEELAACQSMLGEFDEALDSQLAILEGREALLGLDDLLVGASATALGTSYTNLGRHAEALPYLRRGLDIMTRAQGVEYWGRAMALNNLACGLMQLGELEEARARFAECIRIADNYRGSSFAVGDAREAGFLALANLGFLDRHQEDHDSATAHFEQALDSYADLEDSLHYRAVQISLAKEYERMDLHIDAEALARAACESHDRIPIAAVRLGDLQVLVRLALRNGSPAELESLLETELGRLSSDGSEQDGVQALLDQVRRAAD